MIDQYDWQRLGKELRPNVGLKIDFLVCEWGAGVSRDWYSHDVYSPTYEIYAGRGFMHSHWLGWATITAPKGKLDWVTIGGYPPDSVPTENFTHKFISVIQHHVYWTNEVGWRQYPFFDPNPQPLYVDGLWVVGTNDNEE